MRAALWALCASLLASAPALAAQGRIVSFQTEDGWTIGGRYLPPRKSRPVVIFIHGAAAGKGEWEAFQDTLSRRGIGSLAIDLRGHGDSQSGPKGRTDFSGFDESGEWTRAGKDIEAAVAYLSKRGIPARRIGYVGASIEPTLWLRPSPPRAGWHYSLPDSTTAACACCRRQWACRSWSQRPHPTITPSALPRNTRRRGQASHSFGRSRATALRCWPTRIS